MGLDLIFLEIYDSYVRSHSFVQGGIQMIMNQELEPKKKSGQELTTCLPLIFPSLAKMGLPVVPYVAS